MRTIKAEDITIPKSKKGRPSSYKPEYAEQAYKIIAETGVTNAGLARIMGISLSSIEKWGKEHEDFKRAIKNGWYDHTTKHVEKSLKDKALGYWYDEVTTEAIILKVNGIEKSYVENREKCFVTDEKTGKKTPIFTTTLVEGVKRKVIHKFIPPSEVALFFWLQNRHPDEWKNVQRSIVETTSKHELTVKHDLSKLGREKLEQLNDIIEQVETAREVEGEITDETGSSDGTRVSVSKTLHNAELANSRNR